MRHTLSVAQCALLLALARPALAQSKIVVRELAPATATSAATFGAIFGVRQLPGGDVLVNDASRRRLLMLDPTLTNATVVLDSAAGAPSSYGRQWSQFIAYPGDSSLFVDAAAQALLLIDPAGRIARAMASPGVDFASLAGSAFAVDGRGRLIYRFRNMSLTNYGQSRGTASPLHGDSLLLVRADFETRLADTIGYLASFTGLSFVLSRGANEEINMKIIVDPLPAGDEWAVLSDGSVAIVRGHDYRIDWIDPDGSNRSTTKLPFDWKRVTDEDKQRLADSARTANGRLGSGGRTGSAGSGVGASGGGGGRSGGGTAGPQTNLEVVSLPLEDIADYYPPIRPGAARADFDGNLWILPATSAQSKTGELVYDVVNLRGELFQRVRLPAGRSIAGFARGGIVYLMTGDFKNGFRLERTHLAPP